MNKKRLAIGVSILLGLLTLAVASAITIYSGESYSFESEEFEYYTVTGNLSNLEGMNVSWENGNTTISFSKYFAPDNFTIILFNLESEIITEHHYSSGSSSIKYVDKIVEVPNYVDREVEVIKEVPSEPKIIVEKKVPIALWIVFGILILLIISFLIPNKNGKENSNSLKEENINEKEVEKINGK